jgi:hypothetical protein
MMKLDETLYCTSGDVWKGLGMNWLKFFGKVEMDLQKSLEDLVFKGLNKIWSLALQTTLP